MDPRFTTRASGPRVTARSFHSRRQFLRCSLAGGAALAGLTACAGGAPSPRAASASSSAASTSATRPAPDRQLGVALLGLGNYSRTQLGPALQRTQYCALRGIVTGTPDKVNNWQKEYSVADRGVYDYQSLPSIANNPDIDVVYVVTPTALHAKYAIMAAEAGKHVWCEKPMAMSVAECRAIIDACRANKVSLSIGYRMHHEPNTQTVMQLAHDRPYGPLTKLSAIAGDKSEGKPGWRMQRSMGGGALYDMGVYAINAIRYTSGEEPLRVVRARSWADRPALFNEVDENTEFELELPSGLVAYGKGSRGDDTNALRVEAERGSYELTPMQSYTGVKGKTSDGKQLDRQVDQQQARQMDDDALALLTQRPPMCPGEEGLRDIQIIEAIFEAARSGGSVAL